MNKLSKILALMLGLMLSGLTVFAMEDEEAPIAPEPAILKEEKAYIDRMFPKIIDQLAEGDKNSNREPRRKNYAEKLRIVHAYNAAFLKFNLFDKSSNPKLGDLGIIDETKTTAKNAIAQSLLVFKKEDTKLLINNDEITEIVLTNLPENIQEHLTPGKLEKFRRALGLYGPASKRLFQTITLAKHDFYSKNCFLVNQYLELTSMTKQDDVSILDTFKIFRQGLENQKQNVSDWRDKEILQIMINAIDAKIVELIKDKEDLKSKYMTEDGTSINVLQFKQFNALNELHEINIATKNYLPANKLPTYLGMIGFNNQNFDKNWENLQPTDWYYSAQTCKNIKLTDQDILQACQNIEKAYLLFIALQLQTAIFKSQLTKNLEQDILSKIIGLIPTTPVKMSVSQSWLYNEFNDALNKEFQKDSDLQDGEKPEEIASLNKTHRLNLYLARFALTFCQQNVWLVKMWRLFAVNKTKLDIPMFNALIVSMQEQQRYWQAQKDAYKQQWLITRAANYTKRMIFGSAEAHLNEKMLQVMIDAAKARLVAKEAAQARLVAKEAEQKPSAAIIAENPAKAVAPEVQTRIDAEEAIKQLIYKDLLTQDFNSTILTIDNIKNKQRDEQRYKSTTIVGKNRDLITAKHDTASNTEITIKRKELIAKLTEMDAQQKAAKAAAQKYIDEALTSDLKVLDECIKFIEKTNQSDTRVFNNVEVALTKTKKAKTITLKHTTEAPTVEITYTVQDLLDKLKQQKAAPAQRQERERQQAVVPAKSAGEIVTKTMANIPKEDQKQILESVKALKSEESTNLFDAQTKNLLFGVQRIGPNLVITLPETSTKYQVNHSEFTQAIEGVTKSLPRQALPMINATPIPTPLPFIPPMPQDTPTSATKPQESGIANLHKHFKTRTFEQFIPPIFSEADDAEIKAADAAPIPTPATKETRAQRKARLEKESQEELAKFEQEQKQQDAEYQQKFDAKMKAAETVTQKQIESDSEQLQKIDEQIQRVNERERELLKQKERWDEESEKESLLILQKQATTNILNILKVEPDSYLKQIQKLDVHKGIRSQYLEIIRTGDNNIIINTRTQAPMIKVNFYRQQLIESLQKVAQKQQKASDQKALAEGSAKLKQGLTQRLEKAKELRLQREREKDQEFGPFEHNIPEAQLGEDMLKRVAAAKTEQENAKRDDIAALETKQKADAITAQYAADENAAQERKKAAQAQEEAARVAREKAAKARQLAQEQEDKDREEVAQKRIKEAEEQDARARQKAANLAKQKQIESDMQRLFKLADNPEQNSEEKAEILDRLVKNKGLKPQTGRSWDEIEADIKAAKKRIYGDNKPQASVAAPAVNDEEIPEEIVEEGEDKPMEITGDVYKTRTEQEAEAEAAAEARIKQRIAQEKEELLEHPQDMEYPREPGFDPTPVAAPAKIAAKTVAKPTKQQERRNKGEQQLKEAKALQNAAAAERILREQAKVATDAAKGNERARLVAEEVDRRKAVPQNVQDLIKKTDANQ